MAAVAVMPWDAAGVRWASASYGLPGDLRRLIELGEVFAHGAGIALILASLAWAIPAARPRLWRVAACAAFPGLAADGIKLLVGRLRPAAFDVADLSAGRATWLGWNPRWFDPDGSAVGYLAESFPSAHAATAAGLAVGLAWLFPRARVPAACFAVLAMLQRVVGAAHWPSDVLAGAAIGLLLSQCLIYSRAAERLFSRIEHRGVSAPGEPRLRAA